jgi:hypothetical protein
MQNLPVLPAAQQLRCARAAGIIRALEEWISMSDVELKEVWADFSTATIDSGANTLGTSREQVLQRVGNDLLLESDRLLVGIWRYTFDVLAFAFLVLLVLIFVFVTRQSFPHGRSNQAVITIAGGVSRYHVITNKDVALRNVMTIDGSLGDLGKVLGHYAVDPIREGSTIRSTDLSSGTLPATALQGREIVVLPIKDSHYKTSELPVVVSLYLSPKTTDVKQASKLVVIRGVHILSSSSGDPGWAATALTPEEVTAILGPLGNADIYASENVP